MALAILKLRDYNDQAATFEADIGTNLYYRYAVGNGKGRVDGFDVLQDVRYQSPLLQDNTSGLFHSWFQFSIPSLHLDQDSRFVQLTSFKDAHGKSPAWSNIVQVWPQIAHLPTQRGPFSMMNQITQNGTYKPVPPFEPCRSVAHTLAENRLSAALFWDELLGLAEFLVPAGSQLIAQLLNEKGGGDVEAKGVETLITSLLKIVKDTQQPAPAKNGTIPASTKPAAGSGSSDPAGDAPSTDGTVKTTPAPPVAAAQTSLALAVRKRRNKQRRWYGVPHKPSRRLSSAQDGGTLSGMAVAGLVSKLAPVIADALKPLFEKAPELVSAYVDSPLRLFNAIAEAERKETELTNKQVADLLQQGNQAMLFNLLLNRAKPKQEGLGLLGVNPALVGAHSFRMARAKQETPNVDKRIVARLIPPRPVQFNGRSRSLYVQGEGITLQLLLETTQTPPDRPIPEVSVTLSVKDTLNGKILFARHIPLQNVYLNEIVPLTLDADDVAKLPGNTELLLSADASWKDTKQREQMAKSRGTQALFLAGRYFLHSIGPRQTQPIALKDPIRYRAFWHKIWEGGSTTQRRWELEATARYYYYLQPTETSNGRIDTKFKPVAAQSKQSENRIKWGGLLKSGLEVALGELNKLLPMMGENEPWSEAELNALATEQFAKVINQQATTGVKLRGRSNQRGTIWAFPVIDLVAIDLSSVTEIGELGEVKETTVVQKKFPVPSAAVFLGMKNGA